MLLWVISSFSWLVTTWTYNIVHDYSGPTFFDGWDFYGNYDNLTLGDVVWLSRADAFQQRLAYVNNAGNAVMKVDNMHEVQFQQKRNSVRITTQAAYAVGSLWITDIVHIPFGCSVWPAFWSKGPTWPDDGEIDILEGINTMDHNQMALHTTPGCMHVTPPNQMGVSSELDCATPSGCVVAETAPNSYASAFAAAGGGVFATQFDVAGIFIWFWSRPNVPPSITEATANSLMDISGWGAPSASFPSLSCNITQFFRPQNLVFDITLCGIWAGLPDAYTPMCGGAGPSGICYNDNVVGPGSRFNDAYFEIKYVRAYTTGGPVPVPTAAAVALPGAATPTVTVVQRTAFPGVTGLTPSPLFYPGGERGGGVGRWRLVAVLGLPVAMSVVMSMVL